jgi:hypothetical protein
MWWFISAFLASTVSNISGYLPYDRLFPTEDSLAKLKLPPKMAQEILNYKVSSHCQCCDYLDLVLWPVNKFQTVDAKVQRHRKKLAS